MAHPYRIGHPGHARARPPARPPGIAGADNTSRTAATNVSAVSGRISCALPCRTTRLAISHWSPPPGTATSGTPASSVLATMPCPLPQIIRSAFAPAVRPAGPARPPPTAASQIRAADPRHRHPRTRRQHLPRHQALHREFGQARGTGGRRRRRHHDQRARRPAVPRARSEVGSKCRGPTTTASVRPVRSGHLQGGQRRDQPAHRAGIVRGQPDSRPAPSDRCRFPCRTERAVSDRITRVAQSAAHSGSRGPARCPAAAALSTAGKADAGTARPMGRRAAPPPCRRTR